MKPHPRIRKAVKWGGLVLTVVLTVVWVASAWWVAVWAARDGHLILIGSGRAVYAHEPRFLTGGLRPGWSFGQSGVPLSPSAARGFPRRKPEFRWWFGTSDSTRRTGSALPLWCPALLMVIPTTLAWRFDLLARRRARIGACPTCGYDRRGITGDLSCPECGTQPANKPPARQ